MKVCFWVDHLACHNPTISKKKVKYLLISHINEISIKSICHGDCNACFTTLITECKVEDKASKSAKAWVLRDTRGSTPSCGLSPGNPSPARVWGAGLCNLTSNWTVDPWINELNKQVWFPSVPPLESRLQDNPPVATSHFLGPSSISMFWTQIL